MNDIKLSGRQTEMLISSVFTAVFAVICIFVINHIVANNHIKIKFNIFYIACVIGIFIRLYLAYNNLGHSTDMSCFSAWADMLYHDGFAAFYESEAFTDYPPGYMYILRLLGFFTNSFDLSAGMKSVVLKSVAMLSDILMGFFIYRVSQKSFSKNIAAVVASLYIFNPASVLNSSIWGQVDSVYLVIVAFSIYMLMRRRLIASFWAFSLAIIFKPQSLIFAPVFIFASAEYLFIEKKSKTKFVFAVLQALVWAFLLILPFGVDNVLQQYKDTLSSYPYATVNAFNFWGMIGLNWHKLNMLITVIGYGFIVLICIASAIIFFKNKGEQKYFMTASFLCFATYMFSVKMHERYAFCAVAFALLAFVMSKKRKDFLIHLFISISQVINLGWIYYVYETAPNDYFKSIFINIASAVNIIIFIYQLVWSLRGSDSRIFSVKIPESLQKSESKTKISKVDIIAVVIITLVYGGVSVYRLGDKIAPTTPCVLDNTQEATFVFENETPISQFLVYPETEPVDEDNLLIVEFFDENEESEHTIELNDCEVFSWHFEPIENIRAKTVKISATKELRLMEVAFFDESYNLITPDFVSHQFLTDESHTVPDSENFLNSAYFDEVYHARTAYEFINGQDVYEWTHPPLGKIFIAMGIKLFGMNPFGWRIVGCVFGILMLPFMYIFLKKLIKNIFLSGCFTLVFAFDFMHFAQTRLATIDVYITFFVILMYSFMYSYYKLSFYDKKLSKTFVPLLLSGVCFGLGTASKWTGIYAGAGLCVLFFMTLHKRFKEYLYAKEHPEYEDSEFIVSVFFKNTVKTLAFCILAFVVIPLVIYILSYIPYLKCEGGGIETIIKNQVDMFIYHSKTVLDSTHPFSSLWYEWIIMKRPIWYYSNTLANGLKEGISSFGNPLVWWVGIAAILNMCYNAFVKKDQNAIFIVVGYFSQLLPWVFVDRVVFIYHYFPCVPFVVLAIAYSFYLLYKKNKNYKYVVLIYTIAVIFMFLAFYPVLSGLAINPLLVEKYLRWFDSWRLI